MRSKPYNPPDPREWHRWFAWYPIDIQTPYSTVDRREYQWVWLETIERKKVPLNDASEPVYYWIYR